MHHRRYKDHASRKRQFNYPCLTLMPDYCYICCKAREPSPRYGGYVRADRPQPIHPGITLVQCDGKLVRHCLEKKVLLAINRPLDGGYISCTFYL